MGGQGPMWQEDMSYCLATHQVQTLFEAQDYSSFSESQVARTMSSSTSSRHTENLLLDGTPRSAGFVMKASPTAGGIGYQEECASTISTDGKSAVLQLEGNARAECVGIAENCRGEIRQTVGYHVSLTTGGGKPGEGYPCIQEAEPQIRVACTDEKCFGAGAFAQFKESDIASTLKAQGGDLGGGSENFVVSEA